jgi:hypothetical protein
MDMHYDLPKEAWEFPSTILCVMNRHAACGIAMSYSENCEVQKKNTSRTSRHI